MDVICKIIRFSFFIFELDCKILHVCKRRCSDGVKVLVKMMGLCFVMEAGFDGAL